MDSNTKQAVQHLELLEISLKNQIELCTQHLAQVENAKKLILCSAQLVIVTDITKEKADEPHVELVDGLIRLKGDSINKQVPKCQCASGLKGVLECIGTCSYSKAHCMEVITYAVYEKGLLTTTCPACESNPCICP